jgi:hypothetical protein
VIVGVRRVPVPEKQGGVAEVPPDARGVTPPSAQQPRKGGKQRQQEGNSIAVPNWVASSRANRASATGVMGPGGPPWNWPRKSHRMALASLANPRYARHIPFRSASIVRSRAATP